MILMPTKPVVFQSEHIGLKMSLYDDETQHQQVEQSIGYDTIKEVDVQRAINCKGSKSAGHKELLISNYS